MVGLVDLLNSAEAHKPARFPLGYDLYWDDRRITVHHHFGRGQIAGVQSKEEAEFRVVGIVRRMASGEGAGDVLFGPANVPAITGVPSWVIPTGRSIRQGIDLGFVTLQTCLHFLIRVMRSGARS